MSKSSDIWSAVWEKHRFVRTSAEYKAIWFHLVTSNTAVSGIYPCMIEKIAMQVNVAPDVVREILPTMRNIEYDFEECVVFVVNKHHYRIKGGETELLNRSIIGDHKQTHRAAGLWRMFRERYRSRVTRSRVLSDYFRAVLDDGTHPDLAFPEIKAKARTVDDALDDRDDLGHEKEINASLARYSLELEPDDRESVFEMWAMISQGKRGQYSPRRRAEMLRRLDRFDPLQIANASLSFLQSAADHPRRRNFKYLLGIVKGSAQDWIDDVNRHREEED